MIGAATPFRIRRLLVALDASPQSLAALAAAAALAARSGADVVGLFVEDENLLRLAGQGERQVVHSHSRGSRAAAREEMERSLRGLAARAQRALAAAAARQGVRWTFRVAHGSVEDEILAAAEDADVVCLGRASWFGGRGARLGATAARVVASAPHSVLVVRARERPLTSTAVVFDGGEAATRALAAAAEVASRDGGRVLVLLPPCGDERRELLRRDARERLAGTGATAEFRGLATASPEGIAQALVGDDDALVVACRTAADGSAAVRELVDVLRRPVLVVG